MSTLGQKPATQHVSMQKQTITGDGGTSYTLQQSVGSALDVAVFVNNTRQEPTIAYSASGTTLTMTGAVNSSDHFYVIFLGKAITTTGLPVDAVATTNINASAVTNAKIANSTIDLTSKVTGVLPAANSQTNAPAFKATKSTSQTISANSWQKVEFDSELLDTDNCYDPSTNYRFTPNVAGKYWIYCNLYSGTPNTHIYSAITFNGTRTVAGNIDGSQAGNVYLANFFTFNGSSDYVEVQSYQGTSNGDISTTEQFSVFGGYRLIGI